MKILRVNALKTTIILLFAASLIVPWATVTANSHVTPGSIGARSSTALGSHFVEVDFLGDRTMRGLSQDNSLIEPFVAGTDDGYITLAMTAGTSFASESGQVPALIVFEPCDDGVPVAPIDYIIGDVYRLQAFAADGSGISLDCSPDFELTVNYNPGDLRENTTSIHFSRYDEAKKQWQPYEASNRQSGESQVLAAGRHDGVYAAIATVSSPVVASQDAGIQVRDLTLSTSSSSSGEPVTIRADVVNAGWTAESQTFKLTLSKSVIKSATVGLAPGQSRQFSYTFTPAQAGTYDVQFGQAAVTLTVSGTAGDRATISSPLAWLDATVQKGWPLLLVVLLLALASAFFIARVGFRRPALAQVASAASPVEQPLPSPPPPDPIAVPQPTVRKRARRRALNPVIEMISGPTRRLKAAGPYTYEVKVAGGKPPYTIEWRGNGVTLAVTEAEQVELLREQTWDSGKGNWVFVVVRDAKGRYAEWTDEDGKAKRLFTYGITRSGKVVTSPPRFPYHALSDSPAEA